MKSIPTLILAALAIAAATQVNAVEQDQIEATDALKHHTILPLEKIITSVKRRIGPHFVDVEFERRATGPAYEFEWVNRSGALIETVVDAKTGKIQGRERDED